MSRWKTILFREWPLHFILLFTNWLPDNVAFLRLRGLLISPFLGECKGLLKVGRNVTLYNPLNIIVGNDVYIANGSILLAIDKITLKDEVMVAPYCVLASSNHTRKSNSFRHGQNFEAPIYIGRGAWLGAHVVITAGSIVGDGVLIAAGAVVESNIPSNVIAGGIPAKTIKELA
jgi:acetyltransferase-like isoleucine patch superfamily enzyme